MFTRKINLPPTPAAVAARCAGEPGLVFFDSATEEPDQISIVAWRPDMIMTGSTDADWDALRAELRRRRRGSPGAWPDGFAAGYVTYEGEFSFGFYDRLLVFLHGSGEWIDVGGPTERLPSEPTVELVCEPVEFTAQISRAEYLRRVGCAQEYIAAGDIYQVNLGHQFSTAWKGEPFAYYEALRVVSAAPEAAFMNLGGRQVLSSSPESFLRIREREIETRPIKGTRARGSDAASDAAQARDLLDSPKEAAELLMITDLERNDLGKVAEFGSVEVPHLAEIRHYPQVFHLVATVRARLRADVDHVTAFRSCFPGGSITGTPKKRAMEIIAELEGEPRGIYTGAIGYFGWNDVSAFNIAIRTAVMERDKLHFHVGAGIVADSEPEREYEETLAKAAGLVAAGQRVKAKKVRERQEKRLNKSRESMSNVDDIQRS
jgi:para-aminobenzoate synthetase component 1